MRTLIYAFSILLLASCSNAYTSFSIPANDRMEINAPAYALSAATIKNKSSQSINVEVVDSQSGETLRGFGLSANSKERINVENTSQLVLVNKENENAKLLVSFSPTELPPATDQEYISFKLINPSPKALPLIIPSVMNPNLSPFSESGVDLKVGQEILFKEKGKKYVLLTVSNDIQPNEKINVRKLLNARKKELGI